MRYFFTLMALLATSCCFAQSSDTLYFKDGKGLAGKAAMIKGCMEGIDNKIAQSGIQVNSEATCSCMLDVIASQNTLKQFNAALGKKEADIFASLLKEGSPGYKEALNCVLANMVTTGKKEKEEVPPAPKQETQMGPEVKKAFLESCISSASKTKKLKQMKIDAKVYCNCTWEKIIEKNIPLSELQNLSDTNSPLFQEVIIPCMSEAAKGK